MPKSSPIYTNFNSGEFSPLLEGRSDLEQYAKGGSDYQNTIPLNYGPFMFRPGSMYAADTKTHSEISRLLEFVFSPTDAQIIEMGVSYFRFFNSDGQILDSGSPLEVASTYTAAELFDVHYVQSNDVITLAHGDHKQAKLTRVSASSWTLADYTFVGNPYLPDNTTATTLTAAATTGTGIALAASTGVFEAGHVGTFWKIGSPTGSPEEQGFVEITGYTDSQNVTVTVINTLSTSSATTEWAEAAWSSVRGWPSRCWYFQQRLWFARTDTQPNGLWGSKPFIYDDFDPGTGLADEAISELIPGSSEIQWIVGSRTLLIGTNVGDFVVASGDGSTAVTPESINITQQTGWGSESIQPKLMDSYAYAVQIKGRKFRELAYEFREDSYQSVDTTLLAEHITEGGIVDFAYQRNPYSIVPVVIGGGDMAVMTRDVKQEVLGWAPWVTDGSYESVAVIPHPTEDYDMIWTIVNRTINGSTERHVEYSKSPIIPDRQELCFYVDDGLTYNAYESNTGGTLTLSATTGTSVTATASVSVFVAGDVGQRIRAIDTTTGEFLGEMTITGYTSGTIVTGDVTENFSTTSYVANSWGLSVNSISGLDHLEAKSVALLIDGGTADNLTVASGAITIPETEDGFIINVGLGYTGRWKSLPIESGSATGTSQGKIKRINQCGFKFYRSLGMKVGGDVDHLHDIILRNPETHLGIAEPYVTGVSKPQAINTTNDYEGRIVIQQDKPLPMCVLAVMPLMDTYEK